MMEAARTSETSVDNHFTRQYNAEDSSEHHTRRRENLKSHTVCDFYKTEKQAATASALEKKLHELIGFNGCLPSTRSILKSMGFSWRGMKSNIKLLVEKSDVRVKRISLLRDISRFRREGKCIIYMDQSYILSSHTVGKS
jgi:hypothetical protein